MCIVDDRIYIFHTITMVTTCSYLSSLRDTHGRVRIGSILVEISEEQ